MLKFRILGWCVECIPPLFCGFAVYKGVYGLLEGDMSSRNVAFCFGYAVSFALLALIPEKIPN